jgi:MHS family proline/betaine transporter-like MFS transporter
VLAGLFFPSEDKIASMLATFGVFAIGFLMRPIGGAIFGHVGDRVGRQTALTYSVMLMAIPTFLLGLLPTHAQVGTLATVLLIILRLLQGTAVGGEYTSSVVFLVEQAPPNRRGFVGSWSVFGAIAGILLGSAVGALVTEWVPAAAIAEWGWRIPFLLGLLVGIAGLIIRRHAFHEQATQTASPEPHQQGSPLLLALRTQWKEILQVIGLCLLNAVGFYTLFVYITTYFTKVNTLSLHAALDINTWSMVVLLIFIPISGILSDRFGRKPVLILSALGCLVLAYPLFSLLDQGDPNLIQAGQLCFAVLIGLFIGAGPAAMVELFSLKARCSALSIGYNICLAIFGGTSPMVATYLIEATHDNLAPAYYIMAVAAISLVTILGMKETAHQPLK